MIKAKKDQQMNKHTLNVIAAMLLAGCGNLAPVYHRPPLPVAQIDTAPLKADTFITDVKLQKLVAFALYNNRDLRIAALNIEKAAAQYQIQRASLLPHVNAVASDTASLTPADLSSSKARMVSHNYAVNLGFSAFEIDFFGHVASFRDQILENYLATEEAQKSAKISLIAQVASAYLTLGADLQHLSLANDTQKASDATLTMVKRRFELGVAAQLDLTQSQTVLDSARIDIARYTSLVAQDRNALNLLAGGDIPDALLPDTSQSMNAVRELTDDHGKNATPDNETRHDRSLTPVSPLPKGEGYGSSLREFYVKGLPSELLENRPDILQAEHQLKAANASIGVARAAFFPSITLTTNFGTASRQLNGLFSAGSRAWLFAPQVNLPIFDAGSNAANLKSAKVDEQIYLAKYEKTIQTAFREVADTLSDRANLTDQLTAQQSQVAGYELALKLSNARFQNGVDSYLAVLDSQRSLYAAKHNLINLKLAQSNNLISLYKALGGTHES
jgi:multidrug efflux system outer membrane protein